MTVFLAPALIGQDERGGVGLDRCVESRCVMVVSAFSVAGSGGWLSYVVVTSAHNAVEHEDILALRDLLDAGHDVEDDDGHGWTLLRHAIDVEHDGHVQTGKPLHADVTAFLLARGADPQRQCNGMPVVVEAEIRGHWLAVEIMRAWIARGGRASAV